MTNMAKVTLTIETSTKKILQFGKRLAKRAVAGLDEIRKRDEGRWLLMCQAAMDFMQREATRTERDTKDARVNWDAFKAAMEEEARRQREASGGSDAKPSSDPETSGPATE